VEYNFWDRNNKRWAESRLGSNIKYRFKCKPKNFSRHNSGLAFRLDHISSKKKKSLKVSQQGINRKKLFRDLLFEINLKMSKNSLEEVWDWEQEV
jgi:N12 class adenine-specific DNA methylase